ncbi:MAG: DNA alkylation repair protein, partial [Anaerolineae bacterium]|nr:DNA alkylation repair protein [Anaerolineae bacterium]
GEAMVRGLAGKVSAVYSAFAADAFIGDVTPRLEPLELKARIRAMSEGLRRYLPADYPQAVSILLATLGPELTLEEGMFNEGWFVLPIAQFVEDYGLDHFDVSLDAMVEITKRNTAEFAVRPYIVRDAERVLARLREYVDHPNAHVRRWVSEGTRPRLPWGQRLDVFIRDPQPTLALLEQLKDDPELYVRKSVANHLNDIAKDHPELVAEVAARWYASGSEGTRWIVRHGLRTLIKRGDPAALAILGYDVGAAVTAAHFAVQPETIRVGDSLRLALTLSNDGADEHDVVIDFRVHFVKANGKSSPKVFKWTTRRLAAGESIMLEKSVPLKPVTTRRYYPGWHAIDVQVNGQVLATSGFTLV